jgi:2-keto-4-pentenoate hydratase/2-oxohepta-3-ene-1,7-dioic acid hydratase in catechol pathway
MHIYRLVPPSETEPCYALREGDRFVRLRMTFEELATELMSGAKVLPRGEAFVVDGTPELLAPSEPTKVVCVGLNYVHHAREMNKDVPEEPLLFMKPVSALTGGAGAEIHLPVQSELIHHEGELAVVIGRRARHVSVEDAMAHVLGYTCANDVTARDIQRRENRYTRAKGFDTFCPLGPALVTAERFDPNDHSVTCRVNGEVRQQSRLDDLIWKIPELVSFISHVMTLEPGDVVLTGTPAGVGELRAGDVVDVEIDGIGVLHNRVVG